jgi:putative ABC transport system ATP-binding protein
VAAARALIHKPGIIFGDEPTAALDKHAKRDFHEMLSRFVREYNIPVVMVSHEEGVEQYADNIIRLDDGRIANPQ